MDRIESRLVDRVMENGSCPVCGRKVYCILTGTRQIGPINSVHCVYRSIIFSHEDGIRLDDDKDNPKTPKIDGGIVHRVDVDEVVDAGYDEVLEDDMTLPLSILEHAGPMGLDHLREVLSRERDVFTAEEMIRELLDEHDTEILVRKRE